MAYLRGDTYVWSSGDRVHLWVGDGDDGWRESGWATGRLADAAGVAVEQNTMDEYVVMRFAELREEGRVRDVSARALVKHGGNGGCVALVARRDEMDV